MILLSAIVFDDNYILLLSIDIRKAPLKHRMNLLRFVSLCLQQCFNPYFYQKKEQKVAWREDVFNADDLETEVEFSGVAWYWCMRKSILQTVTEWPCSIWELV